MICGSKIIRYTESLLSFPHFSGTIWNQVAKVLAFQAGGLGLSSHTKWIALVIYIQWEAEALGPKISATGPHSKKEILQY